MTNTGIFGMVVVLIIGAIGGYLIAGSTSTSSQKEMSGDNAAVSEMTNKQSAPLTTNEEKIANATSAAPENIAKDATVLDWPGADGTMAVLKKGTNGWTCLPDYPASPGNDPLCGDQMTMEWFQAYLQHKPPNIAQSGISYMLQGASDASNEDPFAETPPPGMDWMSAGPHIMIFPSGNLDEKLYGTTPGDKPWVMFAGTPYEHLMIPVK